MAFRRILPLVSAAAFFAFATGYAWAGQVSFQLENDGSKPEYFKIATNCFTDTPHQYWNFYTLLPNQRLMIQASSATGGSCNNEVSTFNVWFNNAAGVQFYNFNMGMGWQYDGNNLNGYTSCPPNTGNINVGSANTNIAVGIWVSNDALAQCSIGNFYTTPIP